MSDLSREYYFFLVNKNGFEVLTPKTLEEYISIESSSLPGSYHFMRFLSTSEGVVKYKLTPFVWVVINKEDIPNQIKAWLLIAGFIIS